MAQTPERPHLYIGTITGTSVDGLDIALVDLDGGITLTAAGTTEFPPELKARLLDLGQPGADDLDQIGQTDAALGTFIGESILTFLGEQGVSPDTVRAIGSHGQTLRHHPSGEAPYTVQVGDPNRLAELTGVTVVAGAG